jgi:hypothetical protein
MAASWRINPKIDEAVARIKAAAGRLSDHFPLSERATNWPTVKSIDPLVHDLSRQESTALLLEEIADHVEQRHNTISANADLPEDLPGRNLLLKAGHVSLSTAKTLSTEDLEAIDGIGARRAKQIHEALHPKKVEKPKEAGFASAKTSPVKPATVQKAEEKKAQKPVELDSVGVGSLPEGWESSDAIQVTYSVDGGEHVVLSPDDKNASRFSVTGRPVWTDTKEAEIPDNG